MSRPVARLVRLMAAIGAAVLASAPPASASEREDFRRYVNAVPGHVTCSLWGQGGGQPSVHPAAEWIGGDCFGIADGEDTLRFEVRDDRRWPAHFTLQFMDAGTHPVGDAIAGCGGATGVKVPETALFVRVALPPSVPSGLAGCYPATSGFMVAWWS